MRRALPLLLVAIAGLGVSACSSKGKVKEPTPLAAIEDERLTPRVVWDESPGSGTRGHQTGLRVTPQNDALLGADIEGDVYALDPGTGRTLWEVETNARIAAGPGVSFDLVLLGTLDGEVIALKRANGEAVWRSKLSSEVLATPVSDGNVIVARTGDGKLYGLSAETGARLWVFDRSVPALTLRGLSSPVIVGGVAIAGLDNGRVVAVRVADGQPVWEEVVAVPTGRTELERITDIDAELVLGDGLLYVASFGGELAAVTVDTGDVRWRRSIRSYTGCTLLDKLLIVTDEQGVVWALDAETGAAAWKQEGLLNRALSQPVALDGYAVVTDFDGYLHWLAAADGKIVARTKLPAGSTSSARNAFATPPVVHDGVLYVMNTSGRVAAVAAKPR